MAAPMGPTPYCTARIFFFTMGSVARDSRIIAFAGVRGRRFFASQIGANTIKQSRGAFNGFSADFPRQGTRSACLARALRADNWSAQDPQEGFMATTKLSEQEIAAELRKLERLERSERKPAPRV